MSILDKLKVAQARVVTPKPKQEKRKEPEPEPQHVVVYGKRALVIDDLATQYYVQHENGKCEFVFKSDKQVKLCKKQIGCQP